MSSTQPPKNPEPTHHETIKNVWEANVPKTCHKFNQEISLLTLNFAVAYSVSSLKRIKKIALN
uniref:Uncharacterized protein n=1 Tax=Anguilla anguilla TaxID=7936 RepID=A0A0E9RLB7_ANGAN